MDMAPTLNITIDERHCHGLGEPSGPEAPGRNKHHHGLGPPEETP
jgi:hypothetical protein